MTDKDMKQRLLERNTMLAKKQKANQQDIIMQEQQPDSLPKIDEKEKLFLEIEEIKNLNQAAQQGILINGNPL